MLPLGHVHHSGCLWQEVITQSTSFLVSGAEREGPAHTRQAVIPRWQGEGPPVGTQTLGKGSRRVPKAGQERGRKRGLRERMRTQFPHGWEQRIGLGSESTHFAKDRVT